MNNDVLTEILLHLPVQCLLRFRTVCKYRCRVIESPLFQKLHNHNNNCSKSEDTVFLHVIFSGNGIRVQHNMQSLISYETAHFNDFHGPVNGLICFNNSHCRGPIAICNPFLGQFMNLPSSTPCPNRSCEISKCSAAIGYDDEDYKVVQLLECKTHRSLHAHVYSRKTGAWKELAGDARVVLDSMELYPDVSPMKSACKNGYFAHWRVYGCTMRSDHCLFYDNLILSFDMRNEVFQTVDDGGASYVNTRELCFTNVIDAIFESYGELCCVLCEPSWSSTLSF
ncbi:F-box/kelch-repeat protein At3g23880-like [Salvia hispanica]|uniref:F-box/kelch-repeat protein At3g23880-like n=1 Tax=Salvia hispanica TaxID=49212 RepID=UPI0020092E72|nr:F-box/kelch-repeat protein At3g23880-like [Salvia hispanica]